MNALSRPLVAPTLATALLLVCGPTNAARRVGVSPYDGTWCVVIYTLRGDCGSVRVAAQIVVAAFIPRTKATKRMALSAPTA